MFWVSKNQISKKLYQRGARTDLHDKKQYQLRHFWCFRWGRGAGGRGRNKPKRYRHFFPNWPFRWLDCFTFWLWTKKLVLFLPLLYDLAALSLSYHGPNIKGGKTFPRKRLASLRIKHGPSATWMPRRRRSSLLFEPKQNNIKSIKAITTLGQILSCSHNSPSGC